MRDSRSTGGFGDPSASELQAAGGLSAERPSSFLIVSAWVSTSLRSRSISALMSTLGILPLGEKCLAGFLSASPRKTGEEKVNVKNCSEVRGRA
jgi:hypothetical protein